MKKNFSILILNDGKAGHLNQSKAVARIIQKRKIDQGMLEDELDCKVAEVKFRNRLSHALLALCSIFSAPACRRCLLCMRFCLNKDSFKKLMNSAANIIVSCGSSLSSVNLLLSYKNKARNVILMKPSFLTLNRFDLVIAPEHDRLKPKGNVVLTRIAPNLIDRQYLEEQAGILRSKLVAQSSSSTLKAEELTIGVLIGGDTAKYSLTAGLMDRIISQLKEVVHNLNCRILVTTSRRTPKMVEKLLKENFADFSNCKLLVIANEKNIPEAIGGILGLSDIVIVSGESISMVSEAVSAGKYVLVFMPESQVKTQTKQERFLEKLEKEEVLKVVPVDKLLLEIEKIWEEKPKRIKIKDRERIYQALDRIIG